MKRMLAVLVVLMLGEMLTGTAWGDTRLSEKNWSDESGFYVIRFEYNDAYCWRPATIPEGCPHYDALITVFQIIDGKRQTIGEPFMGTFTDGKCYEDEPSGLVARAKQNAKMQPNGSMEKTSSTDWQTCYTNPVITTVLSLVHGTNALATVSDDQIRELAKSGEICRVLGHVWSTEPVYTWEYGLDTIGCRKCGICGKVQRQRVGVWE